jgi:hypothetical protein
MKVRITAIHELDSFAYSRKELLGLEGIDPIIQPTNNPDLLGWSYLRFPDGLIGKPNITIFYAVMYEEVT